MTSRRVPMEPLAMAAGRTVLYIAGSGRSGSTVLGNVLGQLGGWVHVGELRHLFGEGLRDRGLCGCGAPVPDCAFWAAVVQRTFGDPRPDLAALIALQEAATSAPRALGRRSGGPQPASAVHFAALLGRLYAAIADVAGARVIVDGSKLPVFGRLAGRAPGVELRILHLVRDPRAVAYSVVRRWRRSEIERRGLARVVSMLRKRLQATTRDLLVELLWRRDRRVGYRLLRYEDLVADPQTAIGAIAGDLDDSVPAGFVGPGGSVRIDACHAVSGNRVRLRTGHVVLAPDDEWRTALGAADRWITDLCTFPLRLRYGYAGGTRRHGSRP